MREQTAGNDNAALHDLSANDLIAGFRARQFSPSEVLEDVLAHVTVWEPHIKALYAFDPEGARKAARASTERWQNGEPISPLDGVPATMATVSLLGRGCTIGGGEIMFARYVHNQIKPKPPMPKRIQNTI